MLVISRKMGEKVFIGKDISITVVDIDRNKIRLGIDAPKEVLIMREELIDGSGKAIRPAGNQAAESPAQDAP